MSAAGSDWKRLLEYALSQKCLWDEEKQDWVAPNEKTLKNLVAYIGRMEPSEAKGSDVRAACEAAASDIYRTHLSLTALVPNSPAWADIIEHHIVPVVEARVQAAAVEMRQAAADEVMHRAKRDWKPGSACYVEAEYHAAAIRALPILTNAYDAALLRARIEGRLEQFVRMKEKRPIDPSYWDMHEENGLRDQLAALTQPAPERKEK